MNTFEARQEAKRERLRERAEKKREQSQGLLDQAHAELGAIPFGQPILVGHHSQRPMERLYERNHNRLRKGFKGMDEANELERRAEGVGEAGISSDDPDAIAKLESKIQEVTEHRERWKKINAILRISDETQRAEELAKLELTEEEKSTIRYSSCGVSYILTNDGANIRRMMERINTLKKRQSMPLRPDIEAEWWVIRENREENRIQIFFVAKPSEELRSVLKRWGFRWAPYRVDEKSKLKGAWQVYLNRNGRYSIDRMIEALKECGPGWTDEKGLTHHL